MPLPKPRPGEKESEFIARCTIDAVVENEFPTLSQRFAVCYSLYDGKKQKAANYDTVKYYQGFERQLSIGENKELAKVFRYHVNQYDQAIKQFLTTGKTEGWSELFKTDDLVRIYTNIYVNIGMRISEWYTKNFERYNKKFDPAQYRDVFAFKFAALANQVAGARVTSVQDNRKQVLIKELKRFFSDPEFQALNERDAQKLLRDRFKGISKYQAERIIRTESVAAANFATGESAKQMFNEQDLMKEWITAEDGRVRRIPRDQASHRAMNGVTIPAADKFDVPTKDGIDRLMFPGDPNGSPSNVINCRCTVAYVPKEAAEATMTIQGFGVQDLGQVEEVGENFGLIVNTVAQVAEEVFEEAPEISYNLTSKAEVKSAVSDILEENGMSLGRIYLPSDDMIDFEIVSDNITQFKRLTTKYDLNNGVNEGSVPTFKMVSTSEVYGVIKRQKSRFKGEYRWHTNMINFGDEIPPEHEISNEPWKGFRTFRKSPRIDDDQARLYITTHEFAHLISTSRLSFFTDAAKQLEFWDEIKKVRKQYIDELQELQALKDWDKYNDLYLGTYANTNIDEFFAESFADYELNAAPSKYAIKVGELVTKYFGK